MAKQGARYRYRAVSASSWDHLPFGYERHQGTIIGVRLSEDQPKGPWIDVLGSRHEADELGPYSDFLVRFDDGLIALCATALDTAEFNFQAAAPQPGGQK